MSWLITADLHLTDRPRDAYRFGIFPWLAKQQVEDKPEATFILGDLTDKKDNHSSILVNAIIGGLTLLRPPVFILKGNHDFIDKNTPYFKFLDCIEGLRFITETEVLRDYWITMIPHQPDQISFDKALKQAAPESTLMMHQTVEGAWSESGSKLPGIIMDAQGFAGVYSGDVHRPQSIEAGRGFVHYIGPPYHVRFGEPFLPKVYYARGSWRKVLRFPAPKKVALRVTSVGLKNATGVATSDQVKLTVIISPEEVVNWANIKRKIQNQCDNLGLEVCGIELLVEGEGPKRIISQAKSAAPKDVFSAFCDTEKVADNIREAGKELL